MIKQNNSRSRRERFEAGLGLTLKRILAGTLSGIGVVIMGISLVFPPSAYAHNIDLAKAREVIRSYAREVRDQSGTKYVHYQTSCVKAFPNHNHIARCTVDYQNAEDTAKGVYTCRETIEVKLPPHDRDSGQMTYEIYATHTSTNQCGPHRLNGTRLAD